MSSTNEQSTPEALTDGETTAGVDSHAARRVKRKKASRACFHCQKAHLTCDDSRPCQRCIKRGLDASCQDGIRKKAKYLQDLDNKVRVTHHQRLQTENPSTKEASAHISPSSSIHHPLTDFETSIGSSDMATGSSKALEKTTLPVQDYGLFGDNFLFDYPPLSTYDFDSTAANLEYSMISTMLGTDSTPGADHASPDQFTFPSPSVNNYHRGLPSRQHTITPDQHSTKSDGSWSQMPFAGIPTSSIHQAVPLPYASHVNVTPQAFPHAVPETGPTASASSVPPSPSHSTSSAQAHTARLTAAGGYTDPHGQRPTPVARRPFVSTRGESETVYKAVTKPFSYTSGYHLLNTYLRNRFQREELVRIARAIVGYRPSFIALTKTLREEDLVFMEVCFQRTLLEYEKFVGYSGTPTIVWRRTGQIELVGKEFCLLTQWSREQLLAKQTFIVELMDDSSVVEYFEKFSVHAFGDTSSVQTTCVLLTPQKRAVPCAFCFTVKRDVFDIPMMIVGNFLPVL